MNEVESGRWQAIGTRSFGTLDFTVQHQLSPCLRQGTVEVSCGSYSKLTTNSGLTQIYSLTVLEVKSPTFSNLTGWKLKCSSLEAATIHALGPLPSSKSAIVDWVFLPSCHSNLLSRLPLPLRKKKQLLFGYLTEPGLSYSTWDLRLLHTVS